jgi:hypothetical protein
MDISDFTMESILVPGTLNFDYPKIAALADSDFARFYELFMQTYFDARPEFYREKPITCWDCREEIKEAAQLRRYYGQSLNARCFAVQYGRERATMPSYLQSFFDRVLKLTPSSR